MTQEGIVKGIAAYSREQKVLLRLLRKKGGSFSADDFDRWFVGAEWRRSRRWYPKAVTGDSFILGMGTNGGTAWAFMLELLQHMAAVGTVDAATIDGRIVYFLPPELEGDK